MDKVQKTDPTKIQLFIMEFFPVDLILFPGSMQTTCSVPLRLHSDKTHELFD
jgi:hypothetical protein